MIDLTFILYLFYSSPKDFFIPVILIPSLISAVLVILIRNSKVLSKKKKALSIGRSLGLFVFITPIIAILFMKFAGPLYYNKVLPNSSITLRYFKEPLNQLETEDLFNTCQVAFVGYTFNGTEIDTHDKQRYITEHQNVSTLIEKYRNICGPIKEYAD